MKFFSKIEVWLPTRWGVVLLLILAVALVAFVILNLYPFLAPENPISDAQIVILEGWLPDAGLLRVFERTSPETLLVTTGGPIKFGGSLLNEKTYADITAKRLRLLGVPSQSILVASASDVSMDRTYASAVAVRCALEKEGRFGSSANLYSLGAHGRRSLFLYRLVFGPNSPLGIVSLESEEFDLSHWWRSSHAFKHVLNELTSWIYTQCTWWKYD